MGSIPGSGRPPGEGKSHPLQDSCLENPMDRGAWRAAVHRLGKELDTTERLDNNDMPVAWISRILFAEDNSQVPGKLLFILQDSHSGSPPLPPKTAPSLGQGQSPSSELQGDLSHFSLRLCCPYLPSCCRSPLWDCNRSQGRTCFATTQFLAQHTAY